MKPIPESEARRMIEALEAKGRPQPQARAVLGKSRTRKKQPGPNQTEQRFRNEYLEPLLRSGQYVSFEFEGRRYKLFSIRYTPDWHCRRADGTVVNFEIKPFYANRGKVNWHPGSRERLKVAAGMYPDDQFYAAWFEPGKGWQTERIVGGVA